ncbi:hypothetical protein KJ780_05190 [Candidatus Micrarchaeota archaeon]|nr:hypothetical protein [Candidatus Micrarchaeota archaeon]
MLDIHAFAGESAKKLLETSPEMYLSIAKFSRGNARSVFDTLIEKLQDDSLTKKLLENPKLFTDIFEFLIRKTKKLDLSMNAVTFITLAIINDPNSTNPKTIETLDNLLDAFSMQDSKTTKEIFQDLVLFSRHPEKIPVMLSFYNRLVTISDKKAHSPTGFIGLMQVYPEIKANIKNIFTNLIENNVDLEKDHIFDLLWLMRITNVVPNKAYEYLHQQYLKIPKGSSLSLEQALLLNIESDISLAELLKRFKIDLGISKPKDIEDVRLRINNIDPILGDRFLYLIVQNLVSNTKAISDVNNSIKYAEYLMARPSNNSDVNTYYRNLAKFLINRIVKLVMSEKSIDPELLKDISQRLSSLGVNIPKKQGRATKFLKYIFSGQAGQAVGKATKKLNPLATKSIARFSPDLTTTESPLPIKMRDGSTVSQVSIAGYNIDILAIRSSKQKSKVGFEVNVGGGVSVPNQLRPIALAVGAYTTGRGKPTEFCAMNGKVVNDLISNREGLLIISANGEATIEDINTILSGFDIEKWEQFLKKIKNQQLSVMQQHLLLYQNEIALSPVNSSHVRDNRRIFVTTNDSYMILDVKNVTLYEAALIAKKLGGISAVNLDTGYYDYAAYYDSKDTPTFIGTMDSGILSGASNLVYIYPK